MEFNIALLPGDYIGPEVAAEAVKVVDAVGETFGHVFLWHEHPVGGASILKYGDSLTPEAVELCRRSDAILFGAAGGPISPNDDALLRLRKTFDLYANLRVVKVPPALVNASTLKPEVVEGVAVLQFGGGCQGCGMVDVTLKEGVEILNAIQDVYLDESITIA